MIRPETFTADHIRDIQKRGKFDPALIERVIYAFGLLEAIARTGLQFIYKGGTSLMLLMETPRRFSTDIDIVVDPDIKVETYMETAATIWPFVKMTEHARNATANIEKRHFKFAFAPHTSGIPYNIDKEMEIIKQLYDIAALLDYLDDFAEVKSNYYNIVKTEFKYRGSDVNPEDALRDAIDTAACVVGRGQYHHEEYDLLKKGIVNIRNHIYSENFNGEAAVQRACMVMYLAAAVLTDQGRLPVIKDDSYYISADITSNEYSKLGYIKKTDIFAYKYLIEAIKILTE